MAKSKTITISFKSSQRDLDLYELLNSYDDKSYEIKKLIRSGLRAIAEDRRKYNND